MKPLTWRSAKQADVGNLQVFPCCVRPPRLFGRERRGKPTYADRAQGAVRSLNLHRFTAELGCDGDEIGAVYAYEPDWNNGFVFLGVAAVRLDLQRQGIAQHMMKRFVSDVTEAGVARQLDTVRIETNVEPDNEASLKLLSRWHWQYTGQEVGGEGSGLPALQRWETVVPIAGA